MLVIRAWIHKILVRIANREDSDQISNFESPLTRCFTSNFGSIWHMGREMSFEEFQYIFCHSRNLRYLKRTVLAILNLHVAPMPHPNQVGIQSYIWLRRRFHLKNLKNLYRTILVTLNLNVAIMPLTKIHSIQYVSGETAWKISRPLQSSWILQQKDFSDSESLCGLDFSHQVSVQSNI